MASSAGSIDSWSDSEIRTKLAELGTPVGPVTETTRKILIKKLKRLLQLQNNNANSPAKRRSLLRYSSEESQGEEVDMPPPTTKLKNLRRKTIGHTELSATSDNSVIGDASRSGISERTTRNRKSVGGSLSVQKDSFDTDSDSDLSISSLRTRSRKSYSVDKSALNTSRSTFQDIKIDPEKSLNSVKIASRLLPSSIRIPEPRKPVQEEEEEDEEEEEEEKELEDTEEEDSNVKPPVFHSDFLTRLSSAGKFSGSYRSSLSPKSEWKPSSSSYTQSFITQRNIGSLDDKLYSTRYGHIFAAKPTNTDGHTSLLNRPASTHSSIAPKIRINSFFTQYEKIVKLVIGCVAIVSFLFAIYFLSTNLSTIHLAAIDSDENKYPVCGQEGVDSQICVPESQLKSALDVSKILIPRILELTTKAYCDASDRDSFEIVTMSEEEALKYLVKKMPSVSRPHLEKDLRNFKILVLANPHWEVEIVSKGLTEVKAILFNGDFAARRVDLPTACYLRLMFYKLLKMLIFIGILVGLGFIVLFGARLYKRGQDKHKEEVYNMVNRILNLLSIHHEQNTIPAYLAINNCRDELIPPSERGKKKSVWDDAVEFLEKNESRVRTEVHSLRGENVKVWRWLPAGGQSLSPNTSFDSPSGPVLGRLL